MKCRSDFHRLVLLGFHLIAAALCIASAPNPASRALRAAEASSVEAAAVPISAEPVLVEAEEPLSLA